MERNDLRNRNNQSDSDSESESDSEKNSYNLIDVTFNNISKGVKDGNEKCVICYENFKKKESVKMTTCFHLFHFNCIKEWIKTKKEQLGDYRQYQVDQANLIRNLKDKLLLILLSASHKIREKIAKNFYKSCMRYPNRVKKNKTTPRKKKPYRCFNIHYQQT